MFTFRYQYKCMGIHVRLFYHKVEMQSAGKK